MILENILILVTASMEPVTFGIRPMFFPHINHISGLDLVTSIKHEDKNLFINEASVFYTVGQMRQT